MVPVKDDEHAMDRKYNEEHIMKKVVMENLILTELIATKRVGGEQDITYLVSLTKWMTELFLEGITKRQHFLIAKNEPNLWRAMFATS